MTDYSFDAYLDLIHSNWFDDDMLLRSLLMQFAADEAAKAEDELSRWGNECAGLLRELAEESSMPQNWPSIQHFDPYNHRIDKIVLPESTSRALGEVFGREHLGAVHGNPFVFYAKHYLYAQNGEAGVACPIACTDGLVRVLEALGDRPEHRHALEKIRASTCDRFYHGAQFVTEIQGGSDVPANIMEAIPDGDLYRLQGQKWFCSNINADYFIVTARPEGAPLGTEGVALFLMPAYLDEDRCERNGYTIDRLKNKFGTRELATAEVSFNGSIAYPIGPLEKGISNLVKHVLVTSRFACALGAAAYLRRAERIVTAYAEFRSAFGNRLLDYPVVRETVEAIKLARRRSLAAVFSLLELWEASSNRKTDDSAYDFRIMMSLAKPSLTHRCSNLLHEAMMLLAGNGIEEEFSPLPRLYRDSVILETWEGPHNVLYTQALGDLIRFKVDIEAFMNRVAGRERDDLICELREILQKSADSGISSSFAGFAARIVDAMADRTLKQIQR